MELTPTHFDSPAAQPGDPAIDKVVVIRNIGDGNFTWLILRACLPTVYPTS